jgi:acetolactate decarboxylase
MKLICSPLDTVGNAYRFQRPEKHDQVHNRLFQTSTMAALLDAVYDGEMTVEQLLEHGNFGLGTFNALDGEMIVNDGTVHQLRSDGGATNVPPDLQTPFACVTHFNPEETVTIENPMDKEDFEALVDAVIENPNMFAAIRFTGQFEKIDTRTVFCQCHPYPPMLDVVRKQPTRHFGASNGTMLGFRTPAYMQGVNVAGFHLHFLSADQKRGGHVTDYRVTSGRLEIAMISQVEIQLPKTRQFAEANLSPQNVDEAIRTAEGS